MEKKLEKIATLFTTEFEGISVEHAVKTAVDKLKMSKDELQIKVLSEGQQGLFGLQGEKPAKIKVAPKTDNVENIIKFYFIKLLDFVNEDILFVEVKVQNNVVNITSVFKKMQEFLPITKNEVYTAILTLITLFISRLLPGYKVNLQFKFTTSSK